MEERDLYINLEFDYPSHKLSAILYNRYNGQPNNESSVVYSFVQNFPQYIFFKKVGNKFIVVQGPSEQNYISVDGDFHSNEYKVDVQYQVRDVIVTRSQKEVSYIINDQIQGNFIANAPLDTSFTINSSILGTVKLFAMPDSITESGSLIMNGNIYGQNDQIGNISGNIQGPVKNGGCYGAIFKITNSITINAPFENKGTIDIENSSEVTINTTFINSNIVLLFDHSSLHIGKNQDSMAQFINLGMLDLGDTTNFVNNASITNSEGGEITVGLTCTFINNNTITIAGSSSIGMFINTEPCEKVNNQLITMTENARLILITNEQDINNVPFINHNTIVLLDNSSIELRAPFINMGLISLNNNSYIGTPLLYEYNEKLFQQQFGEIKLTGNSSINLGSGKNMIVGNLIIRNMATLNVYKAYLDSEFETTLDVITIENNVGSIIINSDSGRINIYDGTAIHLDSMSSIENMHFGTINLFPTSRLDGKVVGNQPIGYGLFNGESVVNELQLNGLVYGNTMSSPPPPFPFNPKFDDAQMYGGLVGVVRSTATNPPFTGALTLPTNIIKPINFDYSYHPPQLNNSQINPLFFMGSSSLRTTGPNLFIVDAEMNYLQFLFRQKPLQIVCPKPSIISPYTISDVKILRKVIINDDSNEFLILEKQTLFFNIPVLYQPFDYKWALNYKVLHKETSPELNAMKNGIYEASAKGTCATVGEILLLNFVAIKEVKISKSYDSFYVKINDIFSHIYGVFVGFPKINTELRASLVGGERPFIYKWSIDAFGSTAVVSLLLPGETISVAITDSNDETRCGHTFKNKYEIIGLPPCLRP